MKNIAIYIVLIVGLFACVESDIVEKYNAAQVKTQLTDNDVKTWFQSGYLIDGVSQQSIENCQDTIRLVFEVIRADSTTAYELVYDSKCELFDTTKLGQLKISSFEGIFTDSLNLLDTANRSKYWKPAFIGPSSFSITYLDQGKQVQKNYRKMRTDLLARQVAVWLTDGSGAGRSKTYILTKRNSGEKNIVLNSCSDSLRVVFSRDNSRKILLNQLTPREENCEVLDSEFLGEVSVQGEGNEGFFTFNFVLANGNVAEMDIASIDQNSFSASFTKGGLKEVVTYVVEE